MELNVTSAEASTSGRSIWSRFWASRAHAAAERAENDYAQTLTAAASEDWSDLDALEFIVTRGLHDKDGRPVICVVAKNYPARVLQQERVYRYLVRKLDHLVDESYCVVWFQTQSTFFQNCPGVSWLWHTYERLPAKYRDHLHRLYVVHCDLPLWMCLSAVGPMLSSSLWRKVEWISRVEFLADHMPKAEVRRMLPAFVAEHDALLEDQPLMDYGLVASKEVNAVPGMPPPM